MSSALFKKLNLKHLLPMPSAPNIVRTAPIGIPTSEQQANLLLNVQEIFEELKSLLQDETSATETSITSDIEKMVRRAKDHLSLVDELALTKLGRSKVSTSVSIFDIKPEISKVTKADMEQLEECVSETKKASAANTQKISNETERALSSGQMLLDSLFGCSQKSTLNMLVCYSDVIVHDVQPMKKLMQAAIRAHKDGHMRFIKLRDKANDRVDDIVEEHDMKVAYILNKYSES